MIDALFAWERYLGSSHQSTNKVIFSLRLRFKFLVYWELSFMSWDFKSSSSILYDPMRSIFSFVLVWTWTSFLCINLVHLSQINDDRIDAFHTLLLSFWIPNDASYVWNCSHCHFCKMSDKELDWKTRKNLLWWKIYHRPTNRCNHWNYCC